MNQAGYTLAETLAALLIIGLAFTGLFNAMHVIGLVQTASAASTMTATRSRSAQMALSQLFYGAGPFRSDDASALVGQARALRFGCNEAQPCGALVTPGASGMQLLVRSGDRTETEPLAGYRDAWFSYVDDRAAYAIWPLGAGQRRLLRSIVLIGQTASGDAPIATVRLWREQEPGCRFDPIAQDCRAASP